jgi:hypothetical protein
MSTWSSHGSINRNLPSLVFMSTIPIPGGKYLCKALYQGYSINMSGELPSG